MPFTIGAFSESLDAAGVFTPFAAVPDQHIRTAGDSLFIPAYDTLIGAAAYVGTVGNLARLVAPSLRRINPFYVEPVEELLVAGNPAAHDVRPSRAIKLAQGEQLGVELNSNPAAPEQETVVVWLGSGPIQPVSGAIYAVRFNITLAQLAGAWSFSEIDFIDELPVGNYTVVGGQLIAAGAVAWRVSFVGQWQRPGAIAAQVDDPVGLDVFRAGHLGAWGTFPQENPPIVEVIGSAAAGAATYEGVLDVIPG